MREKGGREGGREGASERGDSGTHGWLDVRRRSTSTSSLDGWAARSRHAALQLMVTSLQESDFVAPEIIGKQKHTGAATETETVLSKCFASACQVLSRKKQPWTAEYGAAV